MPHGFYPTSKRKLHPHTPDMPFDALLVKIDYTGHPETYAVAPLVGYDHGSPRQAALLHEVREDPRQYAVVEAIVAHGEYRQLLMAA
ncbi:hypothetical protein FIBSPDRAFT_872124 [Athelia psychrophila]|uniref:Uncharacterized protein n=1 Tax=Athelia psychrophila TaxID=1759441 RepID=A0A165ZUS5_9AGAM|nr:hypothetical protein FIBSPDRAFT_872124 [Fibularhizoctonia sp. CBS 109695]